MDLDIVINIMGLCFSLFSSTFSCWLLITDSPSWWSDHIWMVALDSFTSMCMILYALYQHHHHHPVSWFLIGGNIPPLILLLLCFITILCYRFRGSQLRCLALHTRIALGATPLIFIVIGLLWIFDVVNRIHFAIFAILAGISSSILTTVRLWYDPKSGDWKIIVRSILGLVSGALWLFIGIRQHNILFVINSVFGIIFGLIHLVVAFFAHEKCKLPRLSQGTEPPLSSESVGTSQS